MKLHCNWKKLKTEFSLNIFLKAWFFLKIPTKGLYPAYNGEIWTGFDLFFVPKNLFQTNYTFLYCKFGHFPLFYKNTVRGLKIQAINFFFLDSGLYDSHTSLCQRAARMVGCCANQGTLLLTLLLCNLATSLCGYVGAHRDPLTLTGCHCWCNC